MEKSVMVVGLDDSRHSFYALDWTLQHFFCASPENSLFKLVVLHAKPLPSTVGGPGSFDLLLIMEAHLKKIAARVMEKAKAICTAKSVHDVIYEVVGGDARNVLCEAVEKHHASVLVVGNNSYGAIKRAVLGSVSDYCRVSDYCAHHAHCSVMIVKRPKIKH